MSPLHGFLKFATPTYGGAESTFMQVSGLPKPLRPQQISTDVNTSQHMSTHPNTDKETPIYGICIFVRKGMGRLPVD
jgi:hypothetical protein